MGVQHNGELIRNSEMNFSKRNPNRSYQVNYTFGLSDEQLFLSTFSKWLQENGHEGLTIQEMALIYQLEPAELNRFEDFAKNSDLTKDQLIDLLNPDEPLSVVPPYDDLQFAMILSGLGELQARAAIFENMTRRNGSAS